MKQEKNQNKINKIKWDPIFVILEKWLDDLKAGILTDSVTPSVSTIAESYSNNRNAPWAILVSTIISLRTKDEVTIVTSKRLLEKAPDPLKLSLLKTEQIEKLIYPAGFYRNKAASLKKAADILLSQYNGKVPSSMDELLALPGVGRKTANLVLTEAFNLDGLCVDIHVHRISNRNGWLSSKNPEETEMILRDILPKKYWKRINYLLVLYGQRICRPVSPFCSKCIIKKYCARLDVERSR
jgi:endonuclease-3